MPAALPDFNKMSRTERRELLRRIRNKPPQRSEPTIFDRLRELDGYPRTGPVSEVLGIIGIKPEPYEMARLIDGKPVYFDKGHAFRIAEGRLIYLG